MNCSEATCLRTDEGGLSQINKRLFLSLHIHIAGAEDSGSWKEIAFMGRAEGGI